MVKFTVDMIRELMAKPESIRNFSVIAHIDHGKSTLTDSLIAKAGIISKDSAGNKRWTDDRPDEIERGITIKSAGVSLYFELGEELNKKPYLFNLIDSPGHVDFSSEVTAALRVTDGALVVVDCVEGKCVQTETVLRQALQERVRPILFLNKVDRLILELQVDTETMYQIFCRSIEGVNIVIGTYDPGDIGIKELNPLNGNVIFGSGKDCWGFNIDHFATLYAKKFSAEKEAFKKKLWGDNFFDAETKKWHTVQNPTGQKVLPRGFCQFILEPIVTLINAAYKTDYEKVKKMATNLQIELTAEDLELPGKPFYKKIMQKWLNAADCLVETIVTQLPSPKEAQAYRYKHLYEGDLDDPCAIAMRDCDPNGPLTMYISKIFPSSDNTRFFSYGRVFSGKIQAGQQVRILGPNYQKGTKIDVNWANVHNCNLMMGRFREDLPHIPCGNLGAVQGIDKFITKTGTLTDNNESCNIRTMKFSVSPVVRVAVEPVTPNDMAKLTEGMRKLMNFDSLVECTIDEQTGEKIIAGSGELHLEICLNDLEKELAKIPIKRSNPSVSYRETVIETGEQCLSKSANKHNRLFLNAEPLDEELVRAIEIGTIKPAMDKKELASTLVTDYGFEKSDVVRIWNFGPKDEGPNILFDMTSACDYMKEIKDSCVTGFNQVSQRGVLADEPLRGVRFNINDTVVHSDNAHRGGAQIIPTMKRACYGSQMLAKPRFQEPYFLLEVTVPENYLSTIYKILNMRRGSVIDQEFTPGSNIVNVKSFLPVSESFGLTSVLRGETSGQAFPMCYFDHWEVMPEDPLAKIGNKASKIALDIRQRKGLKNELPNLEDFLDKL